MSLHLYDTATASVREFVPRVEGEVGIYVCGATVQSGPHIGHLRTALSFDILVRWMRRLGYDVTYISNITDIDDKILAKSAEAGVPWWAWAARFEREFNEAYATVGIEPPTYQPRATGHVPDMVELMTELVERGHAYVGSAGNVFFDVRSFAEYGALTRQKLDELAPAEDTDDGLGKTDPRDFALWKAPRPDEPTTAAWETPFGRGRPGWHLECSAMARRYLGDEFDIHGGGIDLRFPHHENEQAQSRAAGLGFARYWLHTAWVTASGTKMSKSLGNSLSTDVVFAEVPAPVLRYALSAAHYRSMLEYGPATVADATATWERLSGFVSRASARIDAEIDVAAVELPEAFVVAMNDDLNVPLALATVHEHVTAGNTALADGDLTEVRTELAAVRAMLDVLGLDPLKWASEASDDRSSTALAVLVDGALAKRTQARQDRDFAVADEIRDRLTQAGITVEDGPAGPRWSLAE